MTPEAQDGNASSSQMPEQGESIFEALSRPQSYPDHPAAVEVAETHASWVFLAGEKAYKLKKPVVLDFLDYSTPARRRDMCQEEVRLNRRLAPDIYLGVRGVAPDDGGVQLTSEDDPLAIDFVVEMRRYNERDTLAARLRRGELERDQVMSVGRLLASFHDRATRVAAGDKPVLSVRRRFERNLHELLACVDERGEIERALALQRFAHAFVTRHAQTFQTRASRGMIREGHGDLRADHVLVNGGVRVVDCIEFDPEFRELDVADDLAFLVFDLVARGGERLAEPLVRAYREAGGDPGDGSLIAFFAVYRALVRAKVALLRATQLRATSAAHGRQRARARDLTALAQRFAWRARLPLVLVVCGLPASGKSHLASELAQLSDLAHLSSDVIRKHLRGVSPTERADASTYGPEWNARTYAELGRRAAQEALTAGGAIVDATFRHEHDRRAFHSAFADAAPLLFVECQAPRPILARRAARRDRDTERTSDADVAVVLAELDTWGALDEVPANAHIPLRTDRPCDEIVGDLLALLDQRLERLTDTP